MALCSERISHRRSSSSYKYNEIGMGANEDVDQDETCRVRLTLLIPKYLNGYK